MPDRLIALATALLLLVAGTATSAQQAQQSGDTFAGKTLRIVIGFANAGTYGQYAQLAATHLKKHLPGNPAIIVQEMVGAGGLIAINHVAHIAPKDGTVALLAPINIVQDGKLDPATRFDPAGFVWIGRLMELIQLGVASEGSGLTTLEQAKARAYSAGGSGATNTTSMNWHLLNMLAGTRFKVVSGYKGLPESQLAWERGEVDTVMLNAETVAERFAEPVRTGRIPTLFAYADRPLPEIAGKPLLHDFAHTEVEKAFTRIYTVGSAIGRSLALPAGVPVDRVTAWREAFARMLKDPEMLAEIEQRRMRFDPLNGAGVEAIVKRALTLTPETERGVREFYGRLLEAAR